MKKKSKLLSIILLLSFIVAANSMVYAKNVELSYEEMALLNTYPTNIEVTKKIESEQPALEAYYAMLDAFEIEFGTNSYPDSYAGAFITDDNKLCILLTNTSPEILHLYENYCENFGDILFEEVGHNYKELEDAMASAIDAISDYEFTSVYIDVINNNVKIGTNTVQTAAKGIKAYSDKLIEIVYEPPATTEASTQLYGGTPIQGYTLGGCGSLRGKDAVVLCGHGLSEGDVLKLDLNSNYVAFAEVVIQQYAMDESYDYAVATINSGANVTLSNLVKNSVNYTTITSQSNRIPAVGSTVCMYGKTGGFGVGKVTATNSAFNDNRLGVICHGLVKCAWNTGEEAYGGGSSGGPVYSGHVFYGTYSGSNTVGGDFWFSPIGAVPGFSIKTS